LPKISETHSFSGSCHKGIGGGLAPKAQPVGSPLYFILDNIFNSSVRNGVYLRYAQFIRYLLSKQYEITLITRYVEHVKYPDKLRVQYVPFISLPGYEEVFGPLPFSCIGIIPPESIVITLIENFTIFFDLSKHSRVIYGYHTRFELYTQSDIFIGFNHQ
jgi:hypothetical protein